MTLRTYNQQARDRIRDAVETTESRQRGLPTFPQQGQPMLQWGKVVEDWQDGDGNYVMLYPCLIDGTLLESGTQVKVWIGWPRDRCPAADPWEDILTQDAVLPFASWGEKDSSSGIGILCWNPLDPCPTATPTPTGPTPTPTPTPTDGPTATATPTPTPIGECLFIWTGEYDCNDQLGSITAGPEYYDCADPSTETLDEWVFVEKVGDTCRYNYITSSEVPCNEQGDCTDYPETDPAPPNPADCCPTATPTPTGGATATPTPTGGATATPTPTSVATATPTPTSVATATPTPTSPATATPTPTSPATATPTPTPSGAGVEVITDIRINGTDLEIKKTTIYPAASDAEGDWETVSGWSGTTCP